MTKHYRWLAIIVILAAFCLWVALPDTTGFQLDLNNDGEQEFALNVTQSLGLDLVGGLRVLLEAELPPDAFDVDDLREAANNVSRRVNALGLTEATIQVQGSNRVLVELPGVTDPEQAITTIQQTALLEFVDFAGLMGSQIDSLIGQRILTTEQARVIQARQAAGGETIDAPTTVNPNTGLPFDTALTGAALQAAVAQLDPQSGQWFIEFQLKPEFAAQFGGYTGARIGEPMAIVLDGEVLSAPTINAQLTDGGIIEGQFTQEEAQTLALQLRSGALPIPLRVESAVRVGATLGQESVELSIRAGVIGVFVVLLFMLIYYRVPGIAANIALVVFILLNLAIFKLIPITLTLPAITGFLISIGTAVDGNILIFERMKEELRAGKPLMEALDAGFDRAWVAIRDSNLSTIIICIVLFFFGQTPGASIVSGFAVTLALGLVVNLFTAVTVTRTFLYLFANRAQTPLMSRRWLLGV
jgi:protein-export membrane protein SecD